jgi:flavin-dependent dehydrogenase
VSSNGPVVSKKQGAPDFRVAIVGGGPSGTTTALALVREAPELAGRVAIFEKARYPRDKPCAGAIGRRGDALLEAIGVVADVPGEVIDGISVRTQAGESVVTPGRVGRVVRRTEFDHALARAASERGIAVFDGLAVDDVRDDGAAGARLATRTGEITADVVVGCDGVGSLVRRSLGIGLGTVRAQVIEVDTDPVPGDRPRNVIHFDAFDRALPGYVWDFPTVVDGERLVCRGVYRIKTASSGDDSADLADLLARRLDALGVAPGRRKNKRYAERGFDVVSRLAEGRRMLVGEAAGIDGLTGEGIAQAIEYGVLAGRFLASRLRRTHGPVDVGGWHHVVARSRLARDLRLRARILALYHGRWRGEIEQFFADYPRALALGARHFAALPNRWLDVAHVAAAGVLRAAMVMLRG